MLAIKIFSLFFLIPLNESLEWKELGYAKGGDTLTTNNLTSYKEVKFVTFMVINGSQLTYETTLPSYILNSARKLKDGHYTGTGDNSAIQIHTTNTTVSLVFANFAGTSYLDTSYVYVYAR